MHHRLTVATGALLPLFVLFGSPARGDEAPAAEARPAYLDVRLPADARLEVDGRATRSTGDWRRFETPPLTAGKTYYYTLTATRLGRAAKRHVAVSAGRVTEVEIGPGDFRPEETPAKTAKGAPPARAGFVTAQSEGYWWVFRAGSPELAAFRKGGAPEKHVTRINVPPLRMTLKAPDTLTLDEYLAARPGFVTKYVDGRLWVFRAGSKEWQDYQKHGELAKHVTRVKAGPGGVTLKAPDGATLDAYLKAGAK